MMNQLTENQTPRGRSRQEVHNLASSILKISRLPAAPTFDWTSQAANALAPLNADTSFGVIVAQLENSISKCTIESSGVHISSSAQHSIEPGQARCILERMGSTPIELTEEYKNSGYIAPVSRLFPQWTASKASLPWASPHPSQSLAAYAPLSSSTNQEAGTSLVLLVFASHDQSSTAPIDPASFAAALAVLADKASVAIQSDSSDSVLWLTEREQVILNLLIDGNSVRAIAESIARSPHTIHDHVKNLHRKLGATSRGQLITRALGHHHSSDEFQLLTPAIDSDLYHNSNNPARNPDTQSVGMSELKLSTPAATPKRATPLNRTTNAH